MDKKVCFIASSGGHFEQIMMLKPLMKKHKSFVVTEKTNYLVNTDEYIYYLKQVNRHEIKFIPLMILNTLKSLKIFLKEKPDIIISTGALSVIPMCIIGKVFRKKIIFIESFAKITSPTLTGKLVYKFADQFYIQWESLRRFYPTAINKGGIY
ncbi:PssD/Cps14F family polysaccharide biosynthesis glycosyltransferase [Clostridium perfringens]|uniref:PssD/Cps14F family polysaccharide biosynthesis glycosyltransferase n=1 Tax=Clostridium perfringens TaxID=1502 RepID=UPI0021091F91|nr:PssD/Cps14F family polysaccharide biosynthesis glycosyltransferase [Clostridium perfringens]